jgi:DNA repair protein RadD
MVGRGLRLKEHTDHCLILDFGGNIKRHGPITDPRPAVEKGSGEKKGESKKQDRECPKCMEYNKPWAVICSDCGYKFPIKQPADLELDDNSDIMGGCIKRMNCLSWRWSHYLSPNGNEVIKCTYYPDTLTGKQVYEFFTLSGNAWAVQKSIQKLAALHLTATGETMPHYHHPMEITQALNTLAAPVSIGYELNGKFANVHTHEWNKTKEDR